MGLPIDLKLQSNDFTNTATAFFAAYLIAELPTGESTQSNKYGLHHVLTSQSLHLEQGTCGQMAGYECHLMGHRNSMHRRSDRLYDSGSGTGLPGHLRSTRRTLSHAHQ